MEKLSGAEILYIKDGIKSNIRNDGRACSDFRDVWIELDTLAQANGSSTLFLPDISSKIFVGIKMEIGEPPKEQSDEGIINLTLDSMQSSQGVYKDKKESQSMHDDMAYMIENFVLKHLDKKKLVIIPKKKCWIANVDVFTLSPLNYSFLDYISIAIRAAFLTLEVPKLNVAHNQINDEYDFEVLEDNMQYVEAFFNVDTFPILITIGEVEKCLFVDLTEEEHSCWDSKFVFSTDLNGTFYGIHKIGDGAIMYEDLPKALRLAQTTGFKLLSSQNKLYQSYRKKME